MIYISVDIETTGLDPETCNILSIGLVIENTNNVLPIEDLPKLHIAINRENISGSLFAINMNKKLIEDIIVYQSIKNNDDKIKYSELTNTVYLNEEDVVETIFQFLWDNNIKPDKWADLIVKNEYPTLKQSMPKMYLNVAGKNFGTFDLKFLVKLPNWNRIFKVRSCILDPGILFVDWEKDNDIPSLGLCKERAGIGGIVTHNAVEDAIDVIELLRKHYVKN